jgi:transposase, IS6 family
MLYFCVAKSESDGKAAEQFFRKVLKAFSTQLPRIITVDKNAAYLKAIKTLKDDETREQTTQLRQQNYLNNIIEQAHRL